MDAYLAAFAVAADAELVTTDEAFGQFEGLKVTVLGAADAVGWASPASLTSVS